MKKINNNFNRNDYQGRTQKQVEISGIMFAFAAVLFILTLLTMIFS